MRHTRYPVCPDALSALQYHYRGRNARKLELDEYDRLFAESDGTPASCRAARL